GALLVHGYHPWAEDAEIYLPGVERTLSPKLFPRGAEFFEPYTRLSLFHYLIAGSVRVTHLPLEWALFAWQLASIFLLLLACWRLAGLRRSHAFAHGSVRLIVRISACRDGEIQCRPSIPWRVVPCSVFIPAAFRGVPGRGAVSRLSLHTELAVV